MYRKEKNIGNGEKLHPFRTQKDRIFRMLFAEKKELLSLYNAVNGTAYTKEEDLQITTLENALYMTVKNDVSCILDMHLELYEHQSTVNPNIPLRDLDYVARSFEGLIIGRDVYSAQPIELPNPRFVVFYNGRQEQPARKEWRLSDLYHFKEAEPRLELVVTQININPGYNDELLERCPTLRDYMQYTECVRKQEQELPYAQAVELAVDECIREGILEEFLRKNKAEVISMSLFDYDAALHERTLREEGRLEGRREGKAEGRLEGKAEAIILSIRNLMTTMKWTAQQAMDALQIPEAERGKYMINL